MGSSFNKSDYVKSNVFNDVDLHATHYFEGTLIYGGFKKNKKNNVRHYPIGFNFILLYLFQ